MSLPAYPLFLNQHRTLAWRVKNANPNPNYPDEAEQTYDYEGKNMRAKIHFVRTLDTVLSRNMIHSFDILLHIPGKIIIVPYWYVAHGQQPTKDPGYYTVWDANHPFQMDPQLLTLEATINDKYNPQNDDGVPVQPVQEGLEIFKAPNMSLAIGVAQFVYTQRLLGNANI